MIPPDDIISALMIPPPARAEDSARPARCVLTGQVFLCKEALIKKIVNKNINDCCHHDRSASDMSIISYKRIL